MERRSSLGKAVTEGRSPVLHWMLLHPRTCGYHWLYFMGFGGEERRGHNLLEGCIEENDSGVEGENAGA